MKYRETNIPKGLKIIAWLLMIGGFIAGIALGNVKVETLYSDYTKFSFTLALTYWVVSIVTGALILAVAEIIEQLQDIAERISSLKPTEDKPKKHYGLE
jgi:cytochrome b subunit of formate dehydrogenase